MDHRRICIHCMGEKPTEQTVCPHCAQAEPTALELPFRLPYRTILNERYLLGRLLRQDETGLVYLALDLHRSELRSIRELYPAGLCQRERGRVTAPETDAGHLLEQNRQRLLREAEVLRMLQRTGTEAIVQLLDHFEENNTVYLVMEYQEARTLSQYITDNGKCSPEQAVSLMYPIGQTLTKLHSFGVFHGGVAPDRILVRQDGSGLLLDFAGEGLAGTGFCVPPEQQCGGLTGPWTDAYGLAGCLYFCLTGTELPGGDDFREPLKQGLRAAHCRLEPSFAAALAAARDPQQSSRKKSMGELLQAMQMQPRRPNTRLWAALSAGACAAMILLFLLGGSDPSAPASDPVQTTQAPTQSQSAVESAEITLGSYLLQSSARPELIMGIEGGYCDNGARLILTDYAAVNHNRLLVTDHVPDDGFYNLQAAHTNSFLCAGDSLGANAGLIQHYTLRGLDSEKWVFLDCGEADGQRIYMIQNAAGRVIAPKDGVLAAGAELILAEPDPSDPAQKWILTWSERDEGSEAVTVYQPGDAVAGLEGAHILRPALDGESVGAAPAGGEALSFVSGAQALRLDFAAQGDGLYRLRLLSGAEGEDLWLGYAEASDRVMVSADAQDQSGLFRVRYAGFGTYYLETGTGRLLYLQGAADAEPGTVCAADAELSREQTAWLLTKAE